ncbi:hypothetical protein P9112_013794 [Eukaryota sp. TZLM1-RC]
MTSQSVIIDFPEYAGTSFMDNESSMTIHEITSKNPFCTVNGVHFVGEWKYILGSGMIVSNEYASDIKTVVTKKLVFKRVVPFPPKTQQAGFVESLPKMTPPPC